MLPEDKLNVTITLKTPVTGLMSETAIYQPLLARGFSVLMAKNHNQGFRRKTTTDIFTIMV